MEAKIEALLAQAEKDQANVQAAQENGGDQAESSS